jgi:hypothetical protein
MHWWWIVLSAWIGASLPISMLCGWRLRVDVAGTERRAAHDLDEFDNARTAPVAASQSR